MKKETEIAIRESFTNANGLTKLPGSIVHTPRGGPAQAARKRNWIKQIGQRYVLTVCGYREC